MILCVLYFLGIQMVSFSSHFLLDQVDQRCLITWMFCAGAGGGIRTQSLRVSVEVDLLPLPPSVPCHSFLVGPAGAEPVASPLVAPGSEPASPPPHLFSCHFVCHSQVIFPLSKVLMRQHLIRRHGRVSSCRSR